MTYRTIRKVVVQMVCTIVLLRPMDHGVSSYGTEARVPSHIPARRPPSNYLFRLKFIFCSFLVLVLLVILLLLVIGVVRRVNSIQLFLPLSLLLRRRWRWRLDGSRNHNSFISCCTG